MSDLYNFEMQDFQTTVILQLNDAYNDIDAAF